MQWLGASHFYYWWFLFFHLFFVGEPPLVRNHLILTRWYFLWLLQILMGICISTGIQVFYHLLHAFNFFYKITWPKGRKDFFCSPFISFRGFKYSNSRWKCCSLKVTLCDNQVPGHVSFYYGAARHHTCPKNLRIFRTSGKIWKNLIGEFDPGSEWTLAAWLRHASRARSFRQIPSGWCQLVKAANGCVTREQPAL